MVALRDTLARLGAVRQFITLDQGDVLELV